MSLRPTLAAVSVVLLGIGCSGSEPNARNVASVVEAFEAEGLPTLVALNRDADTAPTTGLSTPGNRAGTVEGLIQGFTYGEPDYVRGLAFSADPDHEAPRSAGGRWRIYVLDSEKRVESFDLGTRPPLPGFVRVQRHNVVVLTRQEFRARVERALERTD